MTPLLGLIGLLTYPVRWFAWRFCNPGITRGEKPSKYTWGKNA